MVTEADEPQARVMHLVCDEMLQGLARWLRAAGHDTLLPARGAEDRTVVRLAAEQGRWLLSRDRKLCEHRLARGRVVLLRDNGVAGAAGELRAELGIDWLAAPFTRCLVCNTPLAAVDPAACAAIPPRVRARLDDARHCPGCGQVYWEGGHVRRMRARLTAFAEG